MHRSYASIWNGLSGVRIGIAELVCTARKRRSGTAVALLLTAMTVDIHAQTCIVNNNTDAGANSLRGCVADSNTHDQGPGSSNVINANLPQTITSLTGNIGITENVEIGTAGGALAYRPAGAVGLTIPAGVSGLHLVLGQNFTLVAPNVNGFQAISIGSAGNQIDVLGTLDMSGPAAGTGRFGVVANGGNNIINVSGSIAGIPNNGAAIRALGDQNTINVSGALSNSLPGLAGGLLWTTGNRNTINVSGTITGTGFVSHYGIRIEGNDNQLDVSGTVIENNSSGTIGGIGIAGDNNNINISGTVSATGNTGARRAINILSGTNNSIIVQASGRVTSVGGSTIVFNGNGTSSLTNYGTIVGGVTMGNGLSTLSIGTGSSISGAVTGGTSGNNLLRLIGSGTGSYDGSFTSFQKLEVNATGGKWTLLNNQSYANGVNILDGTLSVNNILSGVMTVRGGRLQGTGSVGATTNFNGGTIAPGNSIGTLLISGNYTGSGGTLEIETQLSGTGSPADRLLINGNATGSTTIKTINLGGTGAITGSGNTDGISIVQVTGASTANAFQLAGGYAAAGPYQYKLRVFDPASSAASELDARLAALPFYDYRLQSLLDPSGNPVAVPQIAAYQALPTGAVRYGASLLDSVHKRLGELRQSNAAGHRNDLQQNDEFYIRTQGSRNDASGNRAAGYNQDIWFVQAGGNILGKDMQDGGNLRIGGALSYGESKLDIDNSSAKVALKGSTLALTSTYQADTGWYLDGVAQVTKYASDIKTSERGMTAAPKGRGYGLSLEGGYPFDLGGGVIIEPQTQLSYQKVKFDRFTDVDNIHVDLRDGESLRGRIGSRIQKTFNANTVRSWSPFLEANLLHEFLAAGSIRASDVDFASDSLGTSLQLGGGIDAQLGVNTKVFASVGYESGLSHAAASAWSGNIGMKIEF